MKGSNVMGLITNEVEIKVHPKHYKYYEKCGYIIPRNGNGSIDLSAFITVKISDLPPCSMAEVELECDNCGKHIFTKYEGYTKRKKYNDKIYCHDCVYKLTRTGINHHNYNPNLTEEDRIYKRNYSEYVDMVKSVLARDNYTCQCCGKKSDAGMVAHHLYGYANYPQYRLDQTEIITLCGNCHIAFHNWYCDKYGVKNKGKCTRTDYEEWLGCTLNQLNKYNGELPVARQVYDYEEKQIYNSAKEYAKIHKCSFSKVYSCCNHDIVTKKYITKSGDVKIHISHTFTVKGHHLFWYNEYKNLTGEQLAVYINNLHYDEIQSN